MTSTPSSYDFTDSDGPMDIRASTVLPATRTDIELRTSDGLTLVGEFAEPVDRPPLATLVTMHPLPTAGGFMDSHVFRKASFRLPALADIAVLRFNTRGTSSPRGRSEGEFDGGAAEQADIEAAVAWAAERHPENIWLVGWSFGTELCLKYGATEPIASAIQGAILLSPPLHRAGDEDLDAWAASGLPLKVLVPEHDDYLQPAAAATRFARVPQAEVIGVDGAKHLWVGEKYAARVLDEIADTVLPGSSDSLPTTWTGSAATAS
ncbi:MULTISPECIES: alpha/beta hydrolase [unclassified Arthrobacter]|uniref:alpha/beta hydrolase n=1 Tax=unclassified Arthrobacter TaxID=235627 RepID=UPI001491502D|nr:MULTISPECIES: alpha/beta fold hydrolase [unclassified Arthrobacter]MBE0010442.1 alpha/beta hydrolase [Arthrobacter sp. AET 35A]NOJ62398.1 alpha/beta hydrolase [Arthrobacter sp. 147(2020)]